MIDKFDPKDKWLLQRYGKFTASLIYKILSKSKEGTGFSPGAITYIEERAVETMTELFERPELEFVEPLLHGKYYEQPAYNAYVKATKNYNMKHFGGDNPCYLPYNDYSGGSPDGLMGEGEIIHWLLEVKCPANPKVHFKYLQFKDQWCLKEQRIEYYSQIQFLLMITGAKGAHFVSYDERWKNEKLKLKVIDVLPDQKFQDNLEIRLSLAQKEKLKIIDKLMSL